MRIRRISGVGMLAMGLGLAVVPTGARAADTVPPLVTSLQTVADGTADVFTAAPAPANLDPKSPPPAPVKGDNPRADITGASLEYAPGWIRMKVQVKQPTDPVKDQAWSDRSDAEWALDTNKDGQPDFTVEFASDKGELYGAVFDVKKPDDKSLCDADSASFSPEDGYTLVIDPKCIGNPKDLGYAVAMFFDTNPQDENAPMASDRVPDQGFQAVGAPGGPAPAPGPAPTAGTPTAPALAPPPGTRAPAVTKPGPSSPTPRTAASAPGANSSATGAPSAPAAAPAPDAQAPSTPLARTGSGSAQHGLFGLGILLVGAGLLVMTRPAARKALIAR